jgi:hypothetical protein
LGREGLVKHTQRNAKGKENEKDHRHSKKTKRKEKGHEHYKTEQFESQ